MSYGIVLRSNTPSGTVEKLVSPEGLAQMLSGLAKPSWDTGLLTPATLWMGDFNGKRIVVEYRKPQVTGIWLEGSETPLRVNMPGMVMLREVKPEGGALYRLWAVRRRPRDLKKTKLFNAPLPNVGSTGACWGTVTVEKRDPVSLAPDWKAFLGSRFGDHTCGGKSKMEKQDIRKRLIQLDGHNEDGYPLGDLVDSGYTLERGIKEALK